MTGRGRDPETILADFLKGFSGDDTPLGSWRPHAKAVLAWLRDEGWEVRALNEVGSRGEAVTPERLAEIRAWHAAWPRSEANYARDAVGDLLAEMDRSTASVPKSR